MAAVQHAVTTIVTRYDLKNVRANAIANNCSLTHSSDTEQYWHSFRVMFLAAWWMISINIHSSSCIVVVRLLWEITASADAKCFATFNRAYSHSGHFPWMSRSGWEASMLLLKGWCCNAVFQDTGCISVHNHCSLFHKFQNDQQLKEDDGKYKSSGT